MTGSSLFGQLDRSLHERLGELVHRAHEANQHTALDLAKIEVPRMVMALRTLLEEHQPDATGHCLTCKIHRFRRRSPAPCRAYLAAHLCLMIGEDATSDSSEHEMSTAS